MSDKSATELWTWLLACQICGKAHHWHRRTCKCSHKIEGLGSGGTWEDPEDGHEYRTRQVDGQYIGAVNLHKLREQWANE